MKFPVRAQSANETAATAVDQRVLAAVPKRFATEAAISAPAR